MMSCTEKISGAKKCAKKYLIYREICAIINMYALRVRIARIYSSYHCINNIYKNCFRRKIQHVR